MNSLHETLASLIRIDSVNSFYEGGPGESQIARYIEKYFHDRGIETVQQEVFAATGESERRWNVIAKLPGRDSSRRVVLEAHMDTVSTKGMTINPFEPSVSNGRMYGRGACDTKAGLAGMMHALTELKASKRTPECDVWLAAVVDEEFSFRGVLRFCENARDANVEAAIVAEPTDLRVVTASKGVLRWRIVAHGKSAHSSKTHLGINAIYHMAKVVLAIEDDHRRLQSTSHPLLGAASCNVGKIAGGVQVNFVPDLCSIEIDRRLLPGEEIDTVWKHYEELVRKAGDGDPTFGVVMEPPMLIDGAWTVDHDQHLVQVATTVAKQMKFNAEPCGVPFGSDASKFGRAGVPCIIFGPGSIDQAHAAVEYVELEQVDAAFEFYRRFVMEYQ